MAHQLLDLVEIDTSLSKPCSEGVAQILESAMCYLRGFHRNLEGPQDSAA